jgi:hypothetical protein
MLILCSCHEERSEKQYYSRFAENNSSEKIKNVTVYKRKNNVRQYSIGNLVPGAVKNHNFLYIAPSNDLVIKWNDLNGKKYEQYIDLTGIFPTQFDGGKLFIYIQPDLSVDYTFVLNKTVYSPTNRTAK